MEVLEFLLGPEQLPVYRSVTPNESRVLRALLGSAFRFPLEEGEPLDDFVFEVLSALAVRSDFFFSLPLDADLLGTFELRDADLPTPPSLSARLPRSPLAPLTH